MARIPGIGSSNMGQMLIGLRGASENAKNRKSRERTAMLGLGLGLGGLGLRGAGLVGSLVSRGKDRALDRELQEGRHAFTLERDQRLDKSAMGLKKADALAKLLADERALRLADKQAVIAEFNARKERERTSAARHMLPGLVGPETRRLEKRQDVIRGEEQAGRESLAAQKLAGEKALLGQRLAGEESLFEKKAAATPTFREQADMTSDVNEAMAMENLIKQLQLFTPAQVDIASSGLRDARRQGTPFESDVTRQATATQRLLEILKDQSVKSQYNLPDDIAETGVGLRSAFQGDDYETQAAIAALASRSGLGEALDAIGMGNIPEYRAPYTFFEGGITDPAIRKQYMETFPPSGGFNLFFPAQQDQGKRLLLDLLKKRGSSAITPKALRAAGF
jgi:hypothetical protein